MRRTTKQISETYRGNLEYFRKPHYLRRLRGWAFAIAVIASLAIAFGYSRLGGKPQFYNTGPLSANHSQFQNRCDVCHTDAQPDLTKVLKFDRAIESAHQSMHGGAKLASASGSEEGANVLGLVAGKGAFETVGKLTDAYHKVADLSRMDKACIQCHDAFSLHQPQAAALSLRKVSYEIPLVHAVGCAVCHREHQGPGRMKLPGAESCESCHANQTQLTETLDLVKVSGEFASRKPQVRDLGDGVKRFFPPRDTPHQPVAFKSFAQGHPLFGYQKPGAQDPAAIQYNHWRHEQPDIPMLNGRKLQCVDCHKPGANGVFMQPVTYAQHCADCHSLNFDPDIPQMLIPHRDPEKVRGYLRSLTTQYVDYAIKDLRITEQSQWQAFVVGQFNKLRNRGLTSPEEIERRVFYTGDPPNSKARTTTRSNTGQYFAACAKCHEITPPDLVGAPVVTPTGIADRWLTRGPFTHAPHSHMSCTDCHGAARESKSTKDILMPTLQSCTECHRELDGAKVQPLKTGTPHELTEKQKREGGVAYSCMSCHKFHTPPEANAILVRAQP
jgi:hypothetical protein